MLNNSKYDGCTVRSEFANNVSIFGHSMDIHRHVHAAPCMIQHGSQGGNVVSTAGEQPLPNNTSRAWGGLIAVENDLRGATRTLTRCQKNQPPKFKLRNPLQTCDIYGPGSKFDG